MNKEIKQWIDNASYKELLCKWRFAPIGDEMFQGETGAYFLKVMHEKRQRCDYVAASKSVGW